MQLGNHITAALITAVILTGLYFSYTSLPTQPQESNKISADNREFNIAIIQPVTHPALEEIKKGFEHSFNELTDRAHYKVFNGNGNRTLLTAQANEIIHGNYDLVVSLGTAPALVLKELAATNVHKTPCIVAAANFPVEFGLINSVEKSGTNFVATIEVEDISKQIKLLGKLVPSVKSLLLVYSPSPATMKVKEKLEALAKEKGLKLSEVAINASNEILNKVGPIIEGNDCILVLKDNTVVAGIDSLISLCNTHHKLLYTSDLNSGQKGASLAFGVEERSFGETAAQLAELILLKEQDVYSMASVNVDKFVLQLNKSAIVAQQVPIDPQLLELLSITKVI